jgi:tetratricopeptide (TPR) repeat protein
MSDFTPSNLKFWDQHPALQEFLDDKLLDFALYDMEKDTEITLTKSGVTLAPGSVANPITVFSNYVFDTVSHDAFTVKNNQLYASLVSLKTQSQNIQQGKPVVLEDVHISYDAVDIDENYYDNPDFNAVLNKYKNMLHHSQILFPIAGLKAVANLRKLSNDKLFLVSTDKGYSFVDEMEGLDYPYVAFHGSFSMMVNFHAISDYFENTGGHSFIQSQRTDIKTNAFFSGFDLKDMPEFALSLQENVERLSPGDYFVLHRNISENFQHCKLNTLASHMAFTHWDPHIYKRLHKQICDQVSHGDKATVDYLKNHMHCLADNFYYMPETYDVLFDVGFFMHALHYYAESIPYYEKSLEYFGERHHLVYNLAICQHKAEMLPEALVSFKRALELNPTSEETQRYIEYLEKQLARDSE